MTPFVRDGLATALPERPRPQPAAEPELATRAMQRFSCLGASCEDTCCRDFGITIDGPGLAHMRAAVDGNPVLRDKLVRLVVLGMPRPGGGEVRNFVPLDATGGCPLLESDGACGVHKHHGETALSTTCSVFPRTSLAVERRLEVTGSLACPEMARLTLLSADGLDQTPAATPILPRAYVGKTIDVAAGDGYLAAFSTVRRTLLALFARDSLPVGARLVFAANLAAQVDEFFHKGAPTRAGAESVFARRRLDAELAAAESPELLASLRRDLDGFEGGGEVILTAAVSMLIERRRLPHAPRFAAIVKSAFESMQAEAARAGGADAEGGVSPAGLLAIDRRRRALVAARAPGLLDTVLGRYARHFLLRTPYTDSPSLLAYLGRLALSLAAVRLLITGSADVEAQLAAPPEPALDRDVITKTAIAVIQSYTKAIAHHAEFLDAIHAANDKPGGATFGRLVMYAKLIGAGGS